MMILIYILTFFMILDCLLLGLLVLMQLPKKDAGMGTAFGGGAADALFGAGSGNVLTKATKFTAVIFFVLAIVLSILWQKEKGSGGAALERALGQSAPAAEQATNPEAPAANAPVELPELLTTTNATGVSTNPAPIESPVGE